jgi:predicted dehydrogenase
MAALGVGVIGLGVGEQHAIAFANHPDCRVVALCDLDQAKLDSVGARYPQARRYHSAEALLDDRDVQIVAVASYDDHHAGQIVRALDSGRHVFAEKPLCVSDAEAEAIRAALRRAPDLHLSSNTVLRMTPRFRELRADIARGAMGRVFYAEADYNYGRLNKLTQGWRGGIPGYSVMLGGGIHMVDLLLWLTGGRVVEVSALGNGIASAGKFAGNDLAVALLRFADGVVAKVTANFGCVHPHFHRLMIYGTEATFENAAPSAWRYTSRDPAVAPTRIDSPYPGIAKGDLIPSFVAAITGRGTAEVSADDVFASLSVCLAVDRSLASGRPEPVRLF